MEYFTLLTQIGAQKIAAATAANTTVALAEIALGDGNGTVPMPDASKTALVNEVYRAPLNDLRVDENNANWLVAEGYVPSDEGNFWVREVGIFDADGDLIIIGNYSETFKPVTADGVAKDLYMKVITEVSSADAVTLLVDPSVVMASQEFVNERLKNRPTNEEMHTAISAIQTFPIGYPMLSYEAYDFTVVGFGGEFNRVDYPKLWAWVEAHPEFLLSEADWQTKNTTDDMCASYSSGDGVNTFRVPNLNEAFLRASNRGVGTFQADELKEHNHSYNRPNYANAGIYNGSSLKYSYSESSSNTGITGGTETRPKNIALLPLIVAA